MAIDQSGLKRSVLQTALTLAAMLAGVGWVGGAWAVGSFPDYDMAMYQRPALDTADNHVVFPAGLQPLWEKALDRNDGELSRLVIDTFAIAHRQGLDGVTAITPRLVELLQQPDQRLDVVRAAVSTLVALDARDQAPLLVQVADQRGFSVADLVEPALARWQSPLMLETWVDRVTQMDAGETRLLAAINGLGQLRHQPASDTLVRIVQSPRHSYSVRMAAAQAVGQIDPSGRLPVARELIEQPSRPSALHSLLAIAIINGHTGDAVKEFLTQRLDDPSTVVQAAALQRLSEIDVALVARQAPKLLSSPDANVRRFLARAMIQHQQQSDIALLATLLDDVNPTLRREVARGLIALADQPSLRDQVIDRTSEVINTDDWRGAEQAIVVLANLNHKPAGQRMVELLQHPRGEVKVASAWGLTQLKMESLLPAMLSHAQSVYDGFRSGQLTDAMPGASDQVAHLFIAFGDQRYRPAEPLMRQYLPKDNSLGFQSRPAAAWALGWIHEDNPDPDLIQILSERLQDQGSMPPEPMDMRRMCAISLGRMNAESMISVLRDFASVSDTAGLACYWALQQMTGDPIPPVPDTVTTVADWFLSPAPPQAENTSE